MVWKVIYAKLRTLILKQRAVTRNLFVKDANSSRFLELAVYAMLYSSIPRHSLIQGPVHPSFGLVPVQQCILDWYAPTKVH